MKPSVIIALLVGGVIGFAIGRTVNGSPSAVAAAPSAPAGAPSAAIRVPLDESPVHGPANALVTLVEFSDYECPFCSKAHVTVKQLEDSYAGKLRVVMKQNPLPFHGRARPAAKAALAAGEQGKFWEYHDKLFTNQQALQDADLERYAGELGLNVDSWKAAMLGQKVEAQIAKEQALSGTVGANGTPAFFINGRFLSGAQPIDAFKAIIDDELKKAQAMVAQGTPADQVYAKIMASAH